MQIFINKISCFPFQLRFLRYKIFENLDFFIDKIFKNIPKAVAESDVVITNPTHFAVALKYDSTQSEAPVVNAKGEDEVALRIRRIANENQIPVVENRPVARELYTNLEVGDIIPEKYFKVITLIYAQLDKYKNL